MEIPQISEVNDVYGFSAVGYYFSNLTFEIQGHCRNFVTAGQISNIASNGRSHSELLDEELQTKAFTHFSVTNSFHCAMLFALA